MRWTTWAARVLGLAATLLIGLCSAWSFSPAEALGAAGHELSSSFGPDCTGATKFLEPGAVAVDEVDHEIYVADQSRFVLEIFRCTTSGAEAPFSAGVGAGTNHMGTFQFSPGQAASQIAVSPVSHDFYVASGSSRLQAFHQDGEPAIFTAGPGAGTHELLESPSKGVAVDALGDIYVAEAPVLGVSVGVVRVFAADGEELTSFETNSPQSLAVNSMGDLYVDHLNTRSIEKFVPSSFPVTPTTSYAGTLADPGPDLQVAADPSNDNFYVTRLVRPQNEGSHEGESQIIQFNAEGHQISSFPGAGEPGALVGGTEGLAVDGSSGNVYASEVRFGTAINTQVNTYVPAPLVPPSVGEVSATNITEATAELRAQINPNHFGTRYRFQYLTKEAYLAGNESFVGAAETQTAQTSSAGQFGTVQATVSSLAPETRYIFRVAAENSNNEGSPQYSSVVEGEQGEFRTFPLTSPVLPDGRGYELVSPAAKSGEVFPFDPHQELNGSCKEHGESSPECYPGILSLLMPTQVSTDGNSITYVGGPFHPGLSVEANEYLSQRGESGWTTNGLSGPLFVNSQESQGFRAFSPDLSKSIVYQISPVLSPQAPARGGVGFANLYLRSEDGKLQPLITQAPPNRSAGQQLGNGFVVTFGGGNDGTAGSPAFTHLVFGANDALTPADPGVAPAAPGVGVSENNLYEWSNGNLRLINVRPDGTADPNATIGSGRLLGSAAPDFDHAISEDGSHVFWSDVASGQVFVRIDGKETREVKDSGRYLTASADGGKVLLDDGCLYSIATEGCEDLTDGTGGFEGLVGSDETLSRVYFVDTNALPGSFESPTHEPSAGEDNLYGWHDGTVTFIGTLLSGVSGDNEYGFTPYGVWKPSSSDRVAQVSSDGRYLAFQSKARLTGYNNEGVEGSECIRCSQVYEYDAVTNELHCASCNPTGLRPQGKSSLSLIYSREESLGDLPFQQPHNLSSDGNGRLFFNTGDHLSPRDTNGRVSDVYEWEPSGVGSCARAAGCTSLITGGNSPDDSSFVDSTPNGSDAFFITRQQLVPSDTNDQLDLYDARVGGGASASSAHDCAAEACKGQIASSPPQSSAGSNTFAGSGNVKPTKPRCTGKKNSGKKQKCKNGKKKHKKGKHKKSRHGKANQKKRHARLQADQHGQGGLK